MNTDNLGKTLERYFQHDADSGSILLEGGSLESNFERKMTTVEGKEFNVVFGKSRSRRHERRKEALTMKLIEETPAFFRLQGSGGGFSVIIIANAQHHSGEGGDTEGYVKYTTPGSGLTTLPIFLEGYGGQRRGWVLCPNFSPLGNVHYCAWSAPRSGAGGEPDEIIVDKQVYLENKDLLYNAADLLAQIGDPGFRVFFSASGTGNSSATAHYQIIKEPFKAFEALARAYPYTGSGIIDVNRDAWVFPGILARFLPKDKDAILAELDHRIAAWLAADHKNTFCLLCQISGDGYVELFFVRRTRGLCFIEGLSNEISGLECSGALACETGEDFANFPAKIEKLTWREP
jgi:hypothetical protein